MVKSIISNVCLLVLLVLLLSSFVVASLDDELAACGDNVRCKFRVSAESRDADSCDSLEGALADNCKDFVAVQNTMSKEDSQIEASAVEDDSTSEIISSTVAIGVVLVIIVFLFIILFLFYQHYKHNAFIKTHEGLMKYVEDSLDKGVSDQAINEKLTSVGWKESVIKEALRDAKHLKK